MSDFDLWLRTVDMLDRPLTKTEHKVLTGLMDEALDYRVPYEVFDLLHPLIEKKDSCPTCGDERCGCPFHQQTCSHIVGAYEREVAERGETI